MPSENQADQRATSGRKPPKVPRPPETPPTQVGPPTPNDGLESPRSSDC